MRDHQPQVGFDQPLLSVARPRLGSSEGAHHFDNSLRCNAHGGGQLRQRHAGIDDLFGRLRRRSRAVRPRLLVGPCNGTAVSACKRTRLLQLGQDLIEYVLTQRQGLQESAHLDPIRFCHGPGLAPLHEPLEFAHRSK